MWDLDAVTTLLRPWLACQLPLRASAEATRRPVSFFTAAAAADYANFQRLEGAAGFQKKMIVAVGACHLLVRLCATD